MIYLVILIPFLGNVLGTLCVFFIEKVDPKLNKIMYGFSSGIMIAAAVFSLIIPAIDEFNTGNSSILSILPTVIGLICGFLFMILMEFVTVKMLNKKDIDFNNKNNNIQRMILLFVAILIHNVPEGIVTGIGLVDANNIVHAISLAIGIAVQNIPEGVISSLPFKEELGSKKFAFLLGTLSGIIEPIFSILTIKFVSNFIVITPYMLTFAASCMIFVVIKELIPNFIYDDNQENNFNSNIGSFSFLIGFIIMMCLDVCLG